MFLTVLLEAASFLLAVISFSLAWAVFFVGGGVFHNSMNRLIHSKYKLSLRRKMLAIMVIFTVTIALWSVSASLVIVAYTIV